MRPLLVYFARGIDARTQEDVIADDQRYLRLCQRLHLAIVNPFEPDELAAADHGFDLAEHDLHKLRSSDILIADLSLPDYQYVGCIFEIVIAVSHEVPVIVVVGQRDFARRMFFHAYCDFIAVDTNDALEYVKRAHTSEGVKQQMTEMKAYYDRVAPCYEARSFRPAASHQDIEVFNSEREILRKLIARHARGVTCEIGTGSGDWTATICEHSVEVLGLDVSYSMLEQARINLASYDNLRLRRSDVLKEDIGDGLFDCVVVFFLLSLLPRSMQDLLFERLTEIIRPDGVFLFADTKRTTNTSTIGLGRKQLQERRVGDEKFVLYKELFVGGTMRNILEKKGYQIIESSHDSVWFSWAAARRPLAEDRRTSATVKTGDES